MKLYIIALDYSWQFVKRVAEAMKQWDDIVIVNKSNLVIDGSVSEQKLGNEDTVIIAGLDPLKRKDEYERQKQNGVKFATLIHPNNYIDDGTSIGEGCVIGSGVIIYPDSVIGENVVLKEYSSVSHDFSIGRHSVLMEKVTTGGKGAIGTETVIEFGSVIKEGVVVGDCATVKCGSVVLKNIDENQSVSGNPSRPVKKY